MSTTTVDVQQSPMTLEEVKKIKPVAAKEKIKANEITKLLNKDIPMFEKDGRMFIKGMTAVGIKFDEKAKIAGPSETDVKKPEGIDFSAMPHDEPKSMRKPIFIDRKKFLSPLDLGAQTIFGADNRRVFYDTRYPWGCCGRVETNLGVGSGVMIGPRHLLTCSHIIDWQPNNTTGWLRFSPSYYNGSKPYGDAYGTLTYYKYKVSGNGGIDGTEIKYDYAVIVLDRNIGNSTGWLGSKSYSDSWDGGAYWTHVGYPGDLTGTQRPTYQNGIALDGDFWSFDSAQAIYHKADIWPGQSGGPFWGYWNGLPYAVAVQSAHNPSDNFASGGSDMVDLVKRARNEHP